MRARPGGLWGLQMSAPKLRNFGPHKCGEQPGLKKRWYPHLQTPKLRNFGPHTCGGQKASQIPGFAGGQPKLLLAVEGILVQRRVYYVSPGGPWRPSSGLCYVSRTPRTRVPIIVAKQKWTLINTRTQAALALGAR